MALRNYLGNAPIVAQISSWEITGVDASTPTIFTVTINGKTVTAASLTTAALTITQLIQNLQTCTYGEFTEISWAVSALGSTYFQGTSNNPGQPFVATFTAVGGSGTVSSLIATQANSGPNVVSLSANWDTLPTTGDFINFPPNCPDVLYNLTALDTVQIAGIYQSAASSNKVGLPPFNKTGGYFEYRPTSLTFGMAGSPAAILLNLGYGTGPGTQRFRLNAGGSAFTANISQTGQSEDGVTQPCYLVGSNTSTFSVQVVQGAVEIEGTLTSLAMGYVTNQGTDANVLVGNTYSSWTLKQDGGILVVTAQGATGGSGPYPPSTLTQTAGTATWGSNSTGYWKGFSLLGGALNFNDTSPWNASQTITIGSNGTLQFNGELTAKNLNSAQVNMAASSTLSDAFGTITSGSYTVTPVDCTLLDIKWITKENGSFVAP